MEFFSQILRPVLAHNSHGFAFQMSHWRIFKILDYGLKIEETLISPRPVPGVVIYPVGTFECSCCKTPNLPMDDTNICYHTVTSIICGNCFHSNADQNRHAKPVVLRVNDVDVITSDYPHHIEIIDHMPKGAALEEYWTKIHSMARNAAEVNGMTYLDGKNIEQCRQEILSRWVIKRWRRYIQHNRRSNVFKILYKHGDMGMDAAIFWAKQVCV